MIKQTSLRQKKINTLIWRILKTDSKNNGDAHFHDDDQGQTDESDELSEDEEEEFNSGDVIWAKHGRI